MKNYMVPPPAEVTARRLAGKAAKAKRKERGLKRKDPFFNIVFLKARDTGTLSLSEHNL